MQKNVFIVLGVGRSGTSAIARGLKALGIDLGNMLRPAADANPKGFWEDAEIWLQPGHCSVSRTIHGSM